MPERFRIRELMAEDLPVIVSREGAVYREVYGWNEDFEALVAKIAEEFAREFEPGSEEAWVAEFVGPDGRTTGHAGHIFLVRDRERADVAKLRLLLVEPSAQGMGLGRALVRKCLDFARDANYRKVTLWTQSMLTAAIKIYASEGFVLVDEKPHRSFGHDLVSQTWELEL